MDPGDDLMDPEEFARLLEQSEVAASHPVAPLSIKGSGVFTPEARPFSQSDLNQRLPTPLSSEDARRELASPEEPEQRAARAEPFCLAEFEAEPAAALAAAPGDVDLDREELDVRIELGRMRMELDDVLKLRNGAVVPLDQLVGEPVDLYADGRRIARGQVMVLDDKFCVRVLEVQ